MSCGFSCSLRHVKEKAAPGGRPTLGTKYRLLAEATGLERSNAHKRLAALAARGLAVQVDGRPVRWRRA